MTKSAKLLLDMVAYKPHVYLGVPLRCHTQSFHRDVFTHTLTSGSLLS